MLSLLLMLCSLTLSSSSFLTCDELKHTYTVCSSCDTTNEACLQIEVKPGTSRPSIEPPTEPPTESQTELKTYMEQQKQEIKELKTYMDKLIEFFKFEEGVLIESGTLVITGDLVVEGDLSSKGKGK